MYAALNSIRDRHNPIRETTPKNCHKDYNLELINTNDEKAEEHNIGRHRV